MDQFEPQNNPSQTTPLIGESSRKSFLGKKFLAVLISVFILAGTAYGGIWWWEKAKTDIPPLEYFGRPYTNKEWGFHFRYPLGLNILESAAWDPIKQIKLKTEWQQITFLDPKDELATFTLGVNTDEIFMWGVGCEKLKEESNRMIFKNVEVNKNNTQVKTNYMCPVPIQIKYYFEKFGNTYNLSRSSLYSEQNVKDFEEKAEEILFKFGFNQPIVCIQIVTRARNPKTDEFKDFPTPCDVPEGWEKL